VSESKNVVTKQSDVVWCNVCEKRQATEWLSAMARKGALGGRATNARVLPCCSRCARGILNKWDDLVDSILGES